MIDLIDYKGMKLASAKVIYDYLKIKRRFGVWIKESIHVTKIDENKDFVTRMLQSTGGRPIKDYMLKKDAAIKIVLMSRMPKSIDLMDLLINLWEQKQDLDLLTHKQIITLSALNGFFKYQDNQKQIESKHKDNFVSNSKKRNPYVEFHNYRNKILNIEPDILDAKIKEYCVINSRKLPKGTKRDKINFIDNYINLKNAIWDFMEIKGEVNSLKLAVLAEKMAKAGNLEFFTTNETNLFQKKENINIKALTDK